MLATLRRQSSYIKQTPPDKTAKQFRGQIEGPATGANRITLKHCMQPEPCQQHPMADNLAQGLQFSYCVCYRRWADAISRVNPCLHVQPMDYSLFRSTKRSNLIYGVQFLSARNVVNFHTYPQSKLTQALLNPP